MKRGAANERQFAGGTASPGALLCIRGPALPSVVSGFLTTDGKAGLRMKKMARGDTRYFSRRGMRHFVGRMSSSVRGEHLGERRTRKFVGPLRLARAECHPEEGGRGGGWGRSQSVSHTRAFGNDLCGNAPSRVVSLPDHRTDHSSRDGIPELLVFRLPEKTEIPTQPPSLFPLISPFALPSIRAEMIHPRESKGAQMRKAVEVRFTEERLHSVMPISVRRLSDADF